ncbi:ABC transporter substrate-binding protein [Flavobacterium cerinum]|uniref:ABC transporter substrate-binding protein n=1 Tax=Flavobacterium cerinum TaxID=2502784 RepID=A0ABY5IWP9_9FLAO|nr:ABC transporter substrate-binding protein [Flavobacterium cerinum]UUC47266.1 ABC transporter substrate-binding protein [Flavobacterium cerinum]
MKKIVLFALLSLGLLTATTGCKKEQSTTEKTVVAGTNNIHYAKGLSIFSYDGYSVVKVTNPWPEAKDGFTYILQEKGGIIPDSLQKYTTISVPVQSIVVTSTTHIPALELLGAENKLVGFPNTDYISSEKTRARIAAKKVAEVGKNESLNTEVMIDLDPEVVVGFSIDSNNKTYAALEKAGLKVVYNGDWTEQTPLGKAEWIKLFGALLGKNKEAETIFNTIRKDYNDAQAIAKNATTHPTVFSGAMYQDTWYLPQGDSWAAVFLKDANANYLWKDSKGTGSASLSFEAVFDKAQNADFWIAPGDYSSIKDLMDANPHYGQFNAMKKKQVYSFALKRGPKGGFMYFELAPTRPDLVLKDMIRIVHPELLPDYQLYFFQKLN